jgi:predicted RND superfamily exporter protein
MLTAGLVAALGFASLATTHTVGVRNFGLTAAFGILSALAIELTFIPACRVLLPPPRSRETSRERSHRLVDRALEGVASTVERRPGTTLVTAAVLLGMAAFGTRWLVVNNGMESWLSTEDPFFASHRIFNDRFGGVMTIDIAIDGREPDAMLDPGVLGAIDALESVIAAEPAIGATLSITDFLEVMNQAMHDGDPAFHRVPESRNLAAQYLLLYSPEVLAKFLTSDNRTAVIRARSRSDDFIWAESFFHRLRRVAAERFPPGISVGVAGGRLADQVSLNRAVVRDKLRNMAQVSAVIFVLSALAFRSVVAGLLVLAPVLSAAVVTLGLMGWFGTWLTFGTASYTALGISLGADFAIYLLFRLRDEGTSSGARISARPCARRSSPRERRSSSCRRRSPAATPCS